MRVISLKNFNQRIRVLLQLLHYKNKVKIEWKAKVGNASVFQMNVASIPGWSAKDGDEIICIAELKLGIIGMSCVVPGFSTMVDFHRSTQFALPSLVHLDDKYLPNVGLQNARSKGNGMSNLGERFA